MKVLSSRAKRSTGVAALELALLLPVLCFMCLIVVDYSRVFYALASLSDCARNGAYYAAATSGATSASVRQVALRDATNLAVPPTVTTTTGTDASGYSYVRVTVSTTFTTLTSYPGIPSSVALSRSATYIRTY